MWLGTLLYVHIVGIRELSSNRFRRYDVWRLFTQGCAFYTHIFIHQTGSKNKQKYSNLKKQRKLYFENLTIYYRLLQNVQKQLVHCETVT